MGTPDIAATCLKRILADGFQVVGVYTQPDRPKGRGMKLTASPTKQVALEAGIPVFQPESFREEETVEQLRALKPDLCAVVAYGRILPQKVLDVPTFGCINIHASVLPAYRGSAPYQWAVLDGLKETGVTAMYLVREMDAGDIIDVSKTPIGENETAGELLEKLGLPLDVNDRLSVPEETVLEGGMTFRVDRVLQREERRTQVEPYQVITYYASYLPEGDRVVLTKGRDGELLLSEFVCYVNSVETQRELLEQTRTLAPRAEIQALGTGGVTGPGITQEPIIGDGVILLPTGEKLDYTRVDYVRATAYTHSDPGCTSTTATGTKVHHGTVAVDPKVIPYYTKMFIQTTNGRRVYGMGTALDCGGAVKGNIVDLWFPSKADCYNWGRRNVTVYILDKKAN